MYAQEGLPLKVTISSLPHNTDVSLQFLAQRPLLVDLKGGDSLSEKLS